MNQDIEILKENWFSLVLFAGVTYGILFGVIIGLVLVSDLSDPIYTEEAHTNMFYVSVSGLVVLSPCIYIMYVAVRFGEYPRPKSITEYSNGDQ